MIIASAFCFYCKILDYFSKYSHSYEKKRQAGKQEVAFAIANKTMLYFHFHNPNSAEETANYITKIFIEANQSKIDRMLQEAAEKINIQNEDDKSLSIDKHINC